MVLTAFFAHSSGGSISCVGKKRFCWDNPRHGEALRIRFLLRRSSSGGRVKNSNRNEGPQSRNKAAWATPMGGPVLGPYVKYPVCPGYPLMRRIRRRTDASRRATSRSVGGVADATKRCEPSGCASKTPSATNVWKWTLVLRADPHR